MKFLQSDLTLNLLLPHVVTYWHDHVKLRIHELLLFSDLHQHKHPCLWLWDPTQRFQITISIDLNAITMFYQRLIVDLASVDSCVVRSYRTSQISQRVTHKSSKSPKNVARVSLLYVEKLEWNPKHFCGLGPDLNILQNSVPTIFDQSNLILDRSSLIEIVFLFLQSAGLETWNQHF